MYVKICSRDEIGYSKNTTSEANVAILFTVDDFYGAKCHDYAATLSTVIGEKTTKALELLRPNFGESEQLSVNYAYAVNKPANDQHPQGGTSQDPGQTAYMRTNCPGFDSFLAETATFIWTVWRGFFPELLDDGRF